MPVKLPAPVLGTDEQAGPKSAEAALADEPLPAADEAIAEPDEDAIGVDELAAVLDADELQAAAPTAMAAAIPVVAKRRRFFMVCSFVLFV
jgi:hypothetical protein